MSDKQQPKNAFVREQIKDKPKNYKRMWVRLGESAACGGVFALAVCLVLLFMIPVLRQEEGSVPDTGAQDSQQASVEETEQGSEEKEETQTPEERQPMTLDDYQQIQTELYAIGNTANKSIVTITGVVSDTDWFNNSYEREGQGCGTIIGEGGGKLWILTEKKTIKDAAKIKVTFINDAVAEAKLVRYDGNTGLAALTVDLEDLEYVLGTMKLLGSKGTTGTQASFLELFDGDQETIDKIDPMIAEKMGFKECYPVSGQTYSRKVDTRVANILAGIAASAHKMSNDIRLLQHLKEVEEPFEKSQIGSSAMAYKRNPMRSERIASLSRYVMVDALNPAITSATQWFERTLDDSANKRLSVPEGFLAIDGILDLCLNVVDGLVVYPKVIEKHMMAELPFMATENIMMDAVKAGGDRQELHERIRELSMEAGRTVKVEGKDNDLLERIAADPAFNLTIEELRKSMEPSRYVGRAKEQTTAFITKTVQPVLDAHKEMLGMTAEINV